VVPQADEVLVVDSGSPRAEASRVASECGVRAVRLRRNVGYAGGLNAGIAATTGDVVAILNDDAVAGAGWISASAGRLEDSTVAAVAPKVVLAGRYLEIALDDEPFFRPGDPRPLGRRLETAILGDADVLQELVGAGVHELETRVDKAKAISGRGPRPVWRWTAGRVPFYVKLPDGDGDVELRLNGEPIRPRRVVDLTNTLGGYLSSDGAVGDIGADAPDDERFDSAEERFSLSGVALVATRELLQKVGRFEGRYFATYEDADWCWRARLMGLRLMYEPSVQVRHVRGATTSWLPAARLEYLSERNRLVTLLRNGPLGLAARQTWEAQRGGRDDGLPNAVLRMTPRALAERAVARRRWVLTPTEVFERWAGVDAPARATPA
jgi:GT2 family glycosyltransferase